MSIAAVIKDLIEAKAKTPRMMYAHLIINRATAGFADFH
jgi:hypothetical protein